MTTTNHGSPVPATPAPTAEPRVPMLECDECAELRHIRTGYLGEIHDCPRRGAFRLVRYPASVADAPAVAPVPEDREEATPWPARDVVAELVARAEHLLSHHDCDCHGYELTDQALLVAKAWLAAHGHTEGANG